MFNQLHHTKMTSLLKTHAQIEELTSRLIIKMYNIEFSNFNLKYPTNGSFERTT